MLPSGSWLHIIVGFLLGSISTVFIYTARKLVKQFSAIRKVILCLTIYTFAVVFVMYMYSTGLSGGLLTEWQSLGRPSFGDRALKLLDIGYVQAQSGNRYQFLYRGDSKRHWEVAQEMVKEDSYLSAYPMKDCGTLFFLPVQMENVVDSKAVCMYTGHSAVKIVYAIDNDGFVYLWEHTSTSPYERLAGLFTTLATGAASCILGIVVILLLAAFSGLLTRRKNNGRELFWRHKR